MFPGLMRMEKGRSSLNVFYVVRCLIEGKASKFRGGTSVSVVGYYLTSVADFVGAICRPSLPILN